LWRKNQYYRVGELKVIVAREKKLFAFALADFDFQKLKNASKQMNDPFYPAPEQQTTTIKQKFSINRHEIEIK
jgi:hypothetical protein